MAISDPARGEMEDLQTAEVLAREALTRAFKREQALHDGLAALAARVAALEAAGPTPGPPKESHAQDVRDIRVRPRVTGHLNSPTEPVNSPAESLISSTEHLGSPMEYVSSSVGSPHGASSRELDGVGARLVFASERRCAARDESGRAYWGGYVDALGYVRGLG